LHRPPVLKKDRVSIGSQCEVAKLAPGQLDECGRPGRPAPSLEERQRGKEAGLRGAGIQLDPQRDGVSRGRRGEVRREVKAERGHGGVSGILSIFARNWNKTLAKRLLDPRDR
jgi:hypothetical protein